MEERAYTYRTHMNGESLAFDKPFVQKWKADKRTSYHKDYIPDEQGVFNYEWT